MVKGGYIALTVPFLWLFRRRLSCGFFTTRFVRAADQASAEQQALDLVKEELAHQRLDAYDHRPLTLTIDTVRELDDPADTQSPGASFTFYPEGS